ncbi:MAG: MAPEG family protein [Shimia sp.]|uniref:MAPEG family protein n=1 Tax=Shimia sp. TaxID=1954381 RepID=UPI0040592B36
MDSHVAYAPGLIALLIFVLIVLLQAALVGAGKAKAGLIPGSEPEADYDNAPYRANRSFQNGVEIMPAAALAALVGVMVGVSSWWFNLLLGLFLLLRIVHVVIYAQNVGKPTQGVRTFAYVAGWACIVALCVMEILRLL